MLITSLKPNISREQAVARYSGGFKEIRYGRLRIVEDFYIPYRFFKMNYKNGRSHAVSFLAADYATGKLDLISFDQSPDELDRMTVDAQMVAEKRVNDEEAYKLVQETMTRAVFMKGFFKLSCLNFKIEPAVSLHIPYWVGVYERDGNAHLEIINALRGSFEGAKLREIVAQWLQKT